MRLKDKVAIVTGGGVGIWQSYAHGLAKEGAKVVVADIQEAEAKRVAAEIKSARRRSDRCGRRRHLAGENPGDGRGSVENLWPHRHPGKQRRPLLGLEKEKFMEIDTDEWDRVMAVNVKGCSSASKPSIRR